MQQNEGMSMNEPETPLTLDSASFLAKHKSAFHSFSTLWQESSTETIDFYTLSTGAPHYNAPRIFMFFTPFKAVEEICRTERTERTEPHLRRARRVPGISPELLESGQHPGGWVNQIRQERHVLVWPKALNQGSHNKMKALDPGERRICLLHGTQRCFAGSPPSPTNNGVSFGGVRHGLTMGEFDMVRHGLTLPCTLRYRM